MIHNERLEAAVYYEGNDAYWDGKGEDSNPYRGGFEDNFQSWCRKCWFDGYFDARTEARLPDLYADPFDVSPDVPATSRPSPLGDPHAS